jgi:hypothetical protein
LRGKVCRKVFGWTAIAAALTVCSGGASVDADFVKNIQTQLYAGRTVEAAADARERLIPAANRSETIAVEKAKP